MFIIKNNQPIEICPSLDQKFFHKGKFQQFYCFLEYNYRTKRYCLYQNFYNLCNDNFNGLYYEKRTQITIKDLKKFFNEIDGELDSYFNEVINHKKGIEFVFEKINKINQVNQILTKIAFVSEKKYVNTAQDFLNIITEQYVNAYNHFTAQKNIDLAIKKAEEIVANNEVSDIDGYTVRVFNVGQANCSAVFLKNSTNPYCIFDIGDCNSNGSLKSFLAKMSDNGFVMISHYDRDHINLYNELGYNALKRVFIVHELPSYKLSSTFLFFIWKLYCNNTPLIVIKDGSLTTKPLSIGKFLSIYQGELLKMSKYQSTTENTCSLIGKIKINNKIAVFPGDALEEEFDIGEEKIDLLMIPHHGCGYGKKVSFTAAQAHLFVKHACNNRYKHPALNHVSNFAVVHRFGDKSSKIYDKGMKINDTYTSKIDNNLCYFDYKL